MALPPSHGQGAHGHMNVGRPSQVMFSRPVHVQTQYNKAAPKLVPGPAAYGQQGQQLVHSGPQQMMQPVFQSSHGFVPPGQFPAPHQHVITSFPPQQVAFQPHVVQHSLVGRALGPPRSHHIQPTAAVAIPAMIQQGQVNMGLPQPQPAQHVQQQGPLSSTAPPQPQPGSQLSMMQPTAGSYQPAAQPKRPPERKKNILTLKDPNTGKDITQSVFGGSGASSGSQSTTSSQPQAESSTQSTPPKSSDIADNFREMVHAAAANNFADLGDNAPRKSTAAMDTFRMKVHSTVKPGLATTVEDRSERKDASTVEADEKESTKEEARDEMKVEKKEDKEEVREEVKEELQEELKEELEEELKEELEEELEEEVEEEVEEELKEEVKEGVKEEGKEDKEEAKVEGKIEAKEERKEEKKEERIEEKKEEKMADQSNGAFVEAAILEASVASTSQPASAHALINGESAVPEAGSSAETVSTLVSDLAQPCADSVSGVDDPEEALRSRSPSPVTTGASTQAQNTFEERQPADQVATVKPRSRSPSPRQENVDIFSRPAREETTKSAAKSVSKKKLRARLKDKDQEDDTGDLYDSYRDKPVKEESPPPSPKPKEVAAPEPELEKETTWEDKDLELPDIPPMEDEPVVEKATKQPNGTVNTSIKYTNPDQWTPTNRTGLKVYNREFLLQFKSVAVMPPNLPHIDCIRSEPNPISPRMQQQGRKDVFQPDFLRGPYGSMPPARHGSISRHSHGRAMPMHQQMPKKITVQIQSVEPLKKSENAWSRSTERAEKLPAEEKETMEIMQKFRGVLNKLTPQKFETLIAQVKDFNINSELRLTGCIDLIFEKALMEPAFSVAYANMCRVLSQLKVPMADKKDTQVSFRKLLLTRCQKEFEKDKSEEQWREEMSKAVAEAKSPDEAKLKKAELEEKISHVKKRTLGNIRFIGELFKLKILTENIMHDCIIKLLRSADEESLECLSRLLTTVGKELDHDKAKARMKEYFDRIQRLTEGNKMAPRIKFMLQDLCALKKSNWVPRHEDNNPKTIDQIHREVHQEEMKKREEQAAHAFRQQQFRQQEKGMRGSVGRGRDDGWQTTAPRQTPRVQADPDRLKGVSQRLAQGQQRDAELSLGPGGKSFGQGAGGWGRGSGGSTSGSGLKDQDRGSRYAGLAGPPEAPRMMDRRGPMTRSGSGGPPPRRDTRGSDSRGSTGPSTGAPIRRTSAGREPIVRSSSLSKESLRPSSATSVAPARSTSAPLPPNVPKYPPEVLDKKIDTLLQEYLSVHDVEEAITCVRELCSPQYHSKMVTAFLTSGLDRNEEERRAIYKLLRQLRNKQTRLVSNSQLVAGINGILEFADDYIIDIPLMWNYLASMVAPVLVDDPAVLEEVAGSKFLQDISKAGVFVAEVLKVAVKLEGQQRVCDAWLKSHLVWRSLLPKGEDEKRFLESKGLTFTVEASVNVSYEEQLSALIEKGNSADDLVVWIEDNMKEEKRNAGFIRALVTVIVEAHIRKTGTGGVGCSAFDINIAGLVSFKQVLTKYVDGEELQLEAILALEQVVIKRDHPPDLLIKLFNLFYNEEQLDVIDEETFFSWEDAPVKTGAMGHGTAVQSAKAFLDWLREARPESADA